MNQSASNVLLKFLEEPSDNIIGFLITNNLKLILPTIKSRCEVITINYDVNYSVDDGIANIANRYIESIIRSY